MKGECEFRRIRLATKLGLAIALVGLAAWGAEAFHGGPHSGTYTVWSLNATVGFDPHEMIADLSNQSGHLSSGPVMITAMENGFLGGGGPCGNLYWNPATNTFRYYGVTGGFQFPIDLDRRSTLSTGAHGSFGGGNVWTNVHGNVIHAPYVQFRRDPVNNPTGGKMRRYNAGASSATGIRVNQSNGKVYFGNTSPGQLIELDPTTNAVKKWSTGNNPYFLVLDALGRIYATAFTGGGFPDQIIRLDPTTNVITRWTIPGGGLQGSVGFGTPNYITDDLEGQIWFSQTASNQYGRLNPVTNAFEEFTKPGISMPHGIGTSGVGPTLQMFGQEAGGNTTDVLTRAAATPMTTVVVPLTSTVTPVSSTATFVDFVSPPGEVVITPTMTTVMSTNGSGIDRFPQPPGVFTPTSSTPVVFPNTIFGSVEGSDDVEQFVSSVIVAPPLEGAEEEKVTGGGFYRASATKAATFGFNVQRKTAGGPVTGELEYHNFLTDEDIHLSEFTSLTCADTNADGAKDKCNFSGMGVNKTTGMPVTCAVEVHDNNEPGNKPPKDSFSITGAGCAPSSGELDGGNIQIHKSS